MRSSPSRTWDTSVWLSRPARTRCTTPWTTIWTASTPSTASSTKNGAIRRVNINIAATTVDNYRLLKEAGIGTYILFQETYHKKTLSGASPQQVQNTDYDYQHHSYGPGYGGATGSTMVGIRRSASA